MRHNLRLAHGGYLEQRQARYRHSCVLHHWNHRYVKGISQNWCSVLIWNHRSQLLAGMPLPLGVATSISLDDGNLKLGELDLMMIGPTLATNLLSTGLIAWKAWCAPLASDSLTIISNHIIGAGNAASQ